MAGDEGGLPLARYSRICNTKSGRTGPRFDCNRLYSHPYVLLQMRAHLCVLATVCRALKAKLDNASSTSSSARSSASKLGAAVAFVSTDDFLEYTQDALEEHFGPLNDTDVPPHCLRPLGVHLDHILEKTFGRMGTRVIEQRVERDEGEEHDDGGEQDEGDEQDGDEREDTDESEKCSSARGGAVGRSSSAPAGTRVDYASAGEAAIASLARRLHLPVGSNILR